MVEKESTVDHYSSNTTRVKVWKGKKFRLAHFLVALVLVVGGVLLASYAYNQYSQSMVTTQLIGYNMCYQNGLQANGIQAHGRGMPSESGIDDFVPVLQSALEDGIDTEQGWIEVIDWYHDDPLPLCITDEVVSDWKLIVSVYGGYEPQDGAIIVHQKGPICDIEGVIDIDWTKGLSAYCGPTVWRASFDVIDDCICLDSNQYPNVIAPECLCGPWVIDTDPGTTIPDKDVEFLWCTLWSGCLLPEQSFVVISVQNN